MRRLVSELLLVMQTTTCTSIVCVRFGINPAIYRAYSNLVVIYAGRQHRPACNQQEAINTIYQNESVSS